MRYSIIIPTYNKCTELLIPCVKSIIEYTDMSDVEIIIVANGCTDETRKYADYMSVIHPQIKLIWMEEAGGYAKPVNEGIKKSTGDYIIVLNNDTILLPQKKGVWIEMLVEPFLKDEKMGITSPSKIFSPSASRYFLAFFCAMISRKVINSIGLIDEIFGSYCEDIDFCCRAMDAGFKIEEVPIGNSNSVIANKMSGKFPILHLGNATMGNIQYSEELMAKNNEILSVRYNKGENERRKNNPKYSIIIPTFRHLEDCLRPCCESIIKHTNLNDIEILIVANGCGDDGTKEYIGSIGAPFKLVWIEEQAGYTKSVNVGIKESKGEYIIFLNNDTVILDGWKKHAWVDILMQPFLEDDKTGVTGCMKELCPEANREFILFFCAMTSRKVIDKIGILDECFAPAYGEDTDFNCRAEDAGFTIRQVPIESKQYYADKRQTGNYPLYHIGNHSYKNWKGGEGLIRRNNEILRKRYNDKHIGFDDSSLNVLDGYKGESGYVPQAKVEMYQRIENDRFDKSIERALKCDGHMNEVELTWLAKNCKGKDTVIEIGSWHGRSARAIGDNLSGNSVLYCIDTWNGSKAELDYNHASARLLDGDHAFYEFLQNNIDLIRAGKIIPLRMSSENAARFFKEKNIKADMIFIDAGHLYEETKSDILNWKSILKEGGLLSGHDYDQPRWSGVTQAVNELLPNAKNDWNTTGTIWHTPINKKEIKSDITDVAIIMPVYNSMKYLKRSVESIINQSCKKWMLIAVDDGSTDGSLEMLQEYARSDYRIMVLQSNFKNPARARNMALMHIKQNENIKFIAYCDSDDLWNEEHLRESIEFIMASGTDMTYSDARFISPLGGELVSLAPYHKDFNKEILRQGNFIYISSVVHKAECMYVGFFDESVVPLEDWDYWIKISNHYKIAHRQIKSVTYLCRENGHTASDEQTTKAKEIILNKNQQISFGKLTATSAEGNDEKKQNTKLEEIKNYKTYDCIPFYNELDILEIRLAELNNVVDRFIIVEATKTHQNNSKPLYFKDNIHRFKKYLHKITHIIVDDYPALDSWAIERHQRDAVMRGLAHCSDEDMIIISDCDEIPKADKVKKYEKIKGLAQKLYYYNLNCQAEDLWCEARILSYKELKQLTPCGARYAKCEIIPDAGWHFSYFKDIDGIVEKLHATAHAEYNKPEYTDRERIENAVKGNRDLFGRNLKYKFVEIDNSYPKYVLDNIDYFRQSGFLANEKPDERKIVIVMTYFERWHQLQRTILSLSKSAYKNFEVIIVDDASADKELYLPFPVGFPIQFVRIDKKEKTWHNPVIAYNKGIEKALTLNPDIIILQNAECFHVGDILSYTNKNLGNHNYLSFSCYSIDEKNTFDDKLEEKLSDIIKNNNTWATQDGQNAWYNHPAYRPVGYDFCSAIATENMVKINGYDERYADGVSYGDKDLLMRIEKYGLSLHIIEKPFVVHQWHYYGENQYDQKDLVKKNEELYQICDKSGNHKAVHVQTADFV